MLIVILTEWEPCFSMNKTVPSLVPCVNCNSYRVGALIISNIAVYTRIKELFPVWASALSRPWVWPLQPEPQHPEEDPLTGALTHPGPQDPRIRGSQGPRSLVTTEFRGSRGSLNPKSSDTPKILRSQDHRITGPQTETAETLGVLTQPGTQEGQVPVR